MRAKDHRAGCAEPVDRKCIPGTYKKPVLESLGKVQQTTLGSPGPSGESGSQFPNNFRN